MELKGKRIPMWGVALLLLPLIVAFALSTGHARKSGDDPGWLGVYIQNVDEDLRESEDLPSDDGVLITRVIEDSPADDAGLRRGDVIVEFDGREVSSVRRLTRMIERTEPGEKKKLRIYRNGKEKTIVVEIGEQDEEDSIVWYDDDDVRVRSRHAPGPMTVPDFPPMPNAPHVYDFSLGQLSTSRIGVSLYEMSDQLAEHFGAEDGGALINQVVDDSPAAKAGLKAGDVIIAMDGESVDDVEDIREAIQEKDEGETVAVTILRGSSTQTLDVEVETSSTWSGIGDHRFFHVQPKTVQTPRFEYYFDDDGYDYLKALREDRSEWRKDLQEQMEDLREQLKELKKELRGEGY